MHGIAQHPGANKHEQSRVFPETIEEATLEIVIRYVNLE